MKTSILNDLHIDFYKIPNRQRKDKRLRVLKMIYSEVLDSSLDVPVLIVAGDLGHNTKEALEVLEDIAEIFNYQKVFAVLGNHDLYRSKHYSTGARLLEYELYDDPKGIVHIMFGDTIEYEGVTFGGTMGWYYSKDYLQGWSDEGRLRLWKNRMNDAHYIDGLRNPDDLFFAEYDKLRELVKSCDVLITHVVPSIDPKITERNFPGEDTNAFYCYDGSTLLKGNSLKCVVYGHNHDSLDITLDGTRFITNAMGYPGEKAYRLTVEV